MWLSGRGLACERPEASEMTQWVRVPVMEPDSLGSVLKIYCVKGIGFCKLSSSLCVDPHKISKCALFYRKKREKKRKEKRNSHSILRTTPAGLRCPPVAREATDTQQAVPVVSTTLHLIEQPCGNVLICLSVNHCC